MCYGSPQLNTLIPPLYCPVFRFLRLLVSEVQFGSMSLKGK